MGRWTGIGILLVIGGVLALGLALRQTTPETAPLLVSAPGAVPTVPPARAVDSRPPSISAAPSTSVPAPSPSTRSSATRPSPAPEPKAAASSIPTVPAAAAQVETLQVTTSSPVTASPTPVAIETTPAAVPLAQVTQATTAAKSGSTTVTLKKDAVIGIRTDEAVTSEKARVDDKITAKVSRDVIVDGVTAIPAGTRLEGTVVQVERPTKASPRGKLGIRFTALVRPDNTRVAISTSTIYRDAADPNATPNPVLDANAFSAVLTGTGRMAAARSGAAASTSRDRASGSPVPPAPKLTEAQLPANSALTVHLIAALTITIDRDPN